jgi:hypothetical protein
LNAAGADVNIGDLVVLYIASDNAAPGGANPIVNVQCPALVGVPPDNYMTLISSRNQTAGTLNDGVSIAIYACIANQSVAIGAQIAYVMFTGSSVQAKCIAYQCFTGVSSIDKYGELTGGGSSSIYPGLPPGTTVNANDLMLGLVGNESGIVPGADADTSGGVAWSGNAIATGGSGGDTTKLSMRWVWKIPTTTSVQQFNGNNGATTDYALVQVALSGGLAAPSASISPAIFVDTAVALVAAGSGDANRAITNVNYGFIAVPLIRSVGGITASISPVVFILTPVALTGSTDLRASISPAIFTMVPVPLTKAISDSSRDITPVQFAYSPIALVSSSGVIAATISPVILTFTPIALTKTIGGVSAAVSPVSFIFVAVKLNYPRDYNPSEWGTVLGDYDFSKTATIISSAGAVSSVAASSGSYGAITATGTEQPHTGVRTQNSLNVLDFDGNDKLMLDVPDKAMPITVAMVCANDVPANYATYFGDYIEVYAQDGQYQLLATLSIDTNVAITTAWVVIVAIFNGASSQLWVNGVLIASGNLGAPQTTDLHVFSVGNYKNSGYGFDGGIGQITAFDGVVADPVGLSGGLNSKWFSVLPGVIPVIFAFRPVVLTSSTGPVLTSISPAAFKVTPVVLSSSVGPVVASISAAIFTFTPVTITKAAGVITASISPVIFTFVAVHLTYPHPFTPSEWGTVLGDYDASDISKITLVSGKVSQLAPKSGSLGAAAQSNAAMRPVSGGFQNGLNTIIYGPDTLLIYSLPVVQPPPVTVAVAYAVNNPNITTTIFGDYPELYVQDVKYTMLSAYTIPTNVPVDTNWHIAVCIFNGTQSEFWLDGVLRASGDVGSDPVYSRLTWIVLGNYHSGGYGHNGPIGQTTYYQGVVASPAGLSAALIDKWIPKVPPQFASISPVVFHVTPVALTKVTGVSVRAISPVLFNFTIVQLSATTGGGKLNVWDGTSWVEKPVRYWTGSAWVEKPMYVWTGSSWEFV